VAEDTDGALMLTTSDAAATIEAFGGLGIDYEEHGGGVEPDSMSVADVRRSRAERAG
jgi:hypothetical protein